jgi:hypothetical protein
MAVQEAVCRTCGLSTDHCQCGAGQGPEAWPDWTDEVTAVVVDLTIPVTVGGSWTVVEA